MARQHNHPLPPLSKVICQKYSINQSELEENTRNWQQAQATHKGFFSVTFIRLQAMKREIHLRELQLLDAVRRRFMHHQQTLKETELQRLDDDIERKVSNKQTAS